MRTSLTPRVHPEFEGFWEGCRLGELRVQQCSDCREVRFPPQPLCPACRSSKRDWVAVEGTGTVYTYSGPRMYSDFDTDDLQNLKIGARVSVVFEDIGGGIIGPNFVLTDPT